MFSLKHCLVTLTIAASTVLAQDNLDLILYEDPDSCGGLSAICHDTTYNTCCYRPDRLWGSGQAQGGNGPGRAALFSFQNNLYCGIQITTTYVIPVCILTNLESSVGGIVAQRDTSSKRDMEAPKQHVEAELGFSSGTHHYIISNDKFKTLADPLPKDAVSREEYFKKHADKVVERADNLKTVEAKLIN
ncbi:hypothetical protein NLU13_3793 [Sarocladium strictum]|uniref:Uncharacterized protein n=1 Tax=Sarocladium strictum TaxID=5046 RepID=A0AA39GHP6_SARSR|nr:hypothetical protein NLU13_3793 [Sarocladium strictum]